MQKIARAVYARALFETCGFKLFVNISAIFRWRIFILESVADFGLDKCNWTFRTFSASLSGNV
jgi:hypothetical protein